MTEPQWLDPRAIEDIHEQQIAEHGGMYGMRDRALFESALARARNLFVYGSPSMVEMAAAYAAGIAKNHPFVDGNKRTGFIAAVLFLERNGCAFVADEDGATAAMLALASNHITEAQFAQWLESHTRSIGPGTI